MKFKSWGKTDIGRVRKNNEDFISLSPDLGLYLVADGVGGQNAGEVASQMATEHVKTYIEKVMKKGPLKREPTDILKDAVCEASRKVCDHALSRRECSHMASTFSGAWFVGDQAYFVNVGDSRSYLFRSELLWLLTVDQTLAMDNVRDNRFQERMQTIEYLDSQESGNVLLQAMGSDRELSPYVVSCHLKPDDKFLLCSDGLYGMLSSAVLQDALSHRSESLEFCGEFLLERANDVGGHDNISVVLVHAY